MEFYTSPVETHKVNFPSPGYAQMLNLVFREHRAEETLYHAIYHLIIDQLSQSFSIIVEKNYMLYPCLKVRITSLPPFVEI